MQMLTPYLSLSLDIFVIHCVESISDSLSKDFWNALSNKDSQEFYGMMLKFAGALVVGAPVAVFYR